MKDREYDPDRRKTTAFWAAVSGFNIKAIHNLLGSYKTEADAQKIIDEANFYRMMRDKILGTPWHKLGHSIEVIISLKKIIIKHKD